MLRQRVWSTGIVLSLLTAMVVSGGALAIVVADQWNGMSALDSHTDLIHNNQTSSRDPSPSQLPQIKQQLPPAADATRRRVWQLASDGQTLNSKSVLVYDLTQSETVFDSNSQVVRAPASLVKIMTALVAIEQLPDLQARTTVSLAVINQMRRSNASVAGFLAGESVTVNDLLHGVLLASGGEASYLLAEMAGGQALFVALMNQKAQMLGMNQTRFVDTVGLDHRDQVSSAADIAKLLQFALQNPSFRQVFEAREYLYQGINRQLLISSTLFKRLPQTEINNLTVLGGKTGTTERAGLCLASLVRQKERELLIVTLGAPIDVWPNPSPLQVADLQAILTHMRLVEK